MLLAALSVAFGQMDTALRSDIGLASCAQDRQQSCDYWTNYRESILHGFYLHRMLLDAGACADSSLSTIEGSLLRKTRQELLGRP